MAYTVLPPLNETLPQTLDLYTTVKNIAANIPNTAAGNPGSVGTQYIQMFFGFLPPHGRLLAAGEEITVFGDLQTWLTRFTPNDRARRSLETALSGINTSGVAGQTTAKWGRTIGQCLQIISSSANFVKDPGNGQVGKWGSLNGTATFVTPCWDNNTNFYDTPIYFKSGASYPQGLPTFGWMPGWAGNTAASAFSGMSGLYFAGTTSSGYGTGGAMWSGAAIDAASLAKYFDTRFVPQNAASYASGSYVSGTATNLLNQVESQVYTPFTSSPFFRCTPLVATSFPIICPAPPGMSTTTVPTFAVSTVYPTPGGAISIGAWNPVTQGAGLALAAGIGTGTYHFTITVTYTRTAANGGGTVSYSQACTLVVS